MPFYEAGEHKVDHPPLFACREHKQFLRLRSSFIDEMLRSLEDIVPGNLHEVAAPYVNGDTNAFRLPEYLIPPRVLLYNPDFLKGAAALPYTLVFIDKRFIGIPAGYLTPRVFEGCPECTANPAPEPVRAAAAPKSQSTTSSGILRPVSSAPAKQSVTSSGIRQALPPSPAPPPRKPGAPGQPAPNAPRPGGGPPPPRPKPAGPPPRPPQR